MSAADPTRQVESALPFAAPRGNAPALALWASYSAVQFPVYEHVKVGLLAATGNQAASWFCAGAAAGTVATLATYPMDYLRTVIAVGEPGLVRRRRGGPAAGKSAISRNSLRSDRLLPVPRTRSARPQPAPSAPTASSGSTRCGRGRGCVLWAARRAAAMPPIFPHLRPPSRHFSPPQGARAACAQVVPYVGASFFVYEASMRALERTHAVAQRACPGSGEEEEESAPPAVAASVAGAVAGSAAKLSVYPLDTVKRRHQMHYVMRSSSRQWRCHGSSGSILRSVAAIAREEGLRSLYRGAAPAMLKAAPTSAAYFTAYELTGRLVARSRRG